MKQASAAPIRKVQVGALAGGVSTILVFILNRYAHAEIPADIALAFAAVVTSVLMYLVPPAEQDIVVEGS